MFSPWSATLSAQAGAADQNADSKQYQKLVLGLAAVFYPIVVVIHHIVTPQVQDNLLVRFAIMLSLVVGYWLVSRDIFRNRTVIDWAIFVSIVAIVVNGFYLTSRSPGDPMLLMRLYVGVAIMPTVLLNRKQLGIYIAIVMVLTGALATFRPEPFAFGLYLFGTTLTFAASWLAHPIRTWTIRALRRSSAEIRAHLDERNLLIGRISHDLRTPLVPLVALLPKIEKRIEDEKTREMLSIAIRNVDYMRSLVERTLTYLGADARPEDLRIETFGLAALVDEAVAMQAGLGVSSSVVFENAVPRELAVAADRLLIFEVLNNVLSNSVRYMPDGGAIIISADRAQDCAVQVSVRDEGIGMTAEQLERAFDPFYKADAARRDRSSSGLGLPICRRILALHGQRITVESRGLGEGTTVSFGLRAAGDTPAVR